MLQAQTRTQLEIPIVSSGIRLIGDLAIPQSARAIVVFAHGSGSSRHSPRNRRVAEQLNAAGLATVLFDLLTPQEQPLDQYSRQLRFDIPLLARRLVGAVDWIASQPQTRTLPVGLFGASTGAAAVLIVAAQRPGLTRAVVSRGGRPDLAGEDTLPRVRAPTLLLVGSDDPQVLALNRRAVQAMPPHVHLHVVQGASHLFEEPGALQRVAELARDWFLRHVSTDNDSDAP